MALTALIMSAAGWAYWRWSFGKVARSLQKEYRVRLMMVFPIVLLLFMGARSSFGHRPANNSAALYCDCRMANEIAKNSLYSVGQTYYDRLKYECDGAGKYAANMKLEEAYGLVAATLDFPLGDKDRPFNRHEASHFPLKHPKNLVIFIQESLGAQFLKPFGGTPEITPNLNRLADEGLFFTNLFANGTRSIRGIAGVTSGIFSVPGSYGVVRRPKAQRDFFTLASLLRPLGNNCTFMYGGESSFDNMRNWFYGNGFNQVIEEKDFSDARFHGVWGVSDEDLVERAVREFRQMHASHTPFATVMFSSTNHVPFDYPEGRIAPLENEPVHGVKNAVRFADYAIGKLIDQSRKEAYYDDTVFVIVADHNIRVYGDDLVPVDMFHIPGLILGGGISARKITRLSTQPDVLATALDLMGLDLNYPILGSSVFKPTKKDAALLQFHDFYALREGEKVAVVEPGGRSHTFSLKNEHLLPAKPDARLTRKALAFVKVLDDLYQERKYSGR